MKGRLSAHVAKLLLQGQTIKVLRCEQIVLPGPFHRNKHIYIAYLRKRCNVNPRRGPFHFRAPSKIFYKCVRGETGGTLLCLKRVSEVGQIAHYCVACPSVRCEISNSSK